MPAPGTGVGGERGGRGWKPADFASTGRHAARGFVHLYLESSKGTFTLTVEETSKDIAEICFVRKSNLGGFGENNSSIPSC